MGVLPAAGVGGCSVQLRQPGCQSLPGSGGGHALQRYMAFGQCCGAVAVVAVSGIVAGVCGSSRSARLLLDSADVSLDAKRCGSAERGLRRSVDRLWPEHDSMV